MAKESVRWDGRAAGSEQRGWMAGALEEMEREWGQVAVLLASLAHDDAVKSANT